MGRGYKIIAIDSTSHLSDQFQVGMEPEETPFYKYLMAGKENGKRYSKWELELGRKVFTAAIKTLYDRSRKDNPLYGDLPRAFSHEHLCIFFRNVDNATDHFIFVMLLFTSMRRSEFKTYRVLWDQDLFEITQGGKNDGKKRYIPLFGMFREFLYSMKDSYEHWPRPSSATIYKKFVKIRERMTSLNFVHNKSKDNKNCHQYVPHSFRHTGITIFGEHVDNAFKLCRYSGHSAKKISKVAIYMHYSFDTLRKDLEKAFAPYDFLLEIPK